MRGGRRGGGRGLQRGESMLGENVAIICIERSGPLPLSRCVSRVRVNSPAPAAPTSHLAATSHLRRSQSAVVGSRESEERGEERARREEKRREGDPLEEVRVRMMDERREKQQLQKVLSELREAHRGLREEVELLREENKRLKEAM